MRTIAIASFLMYSGAASASGMQGATAPIAWLAIGLGAIAGAWVGARGGDAREALTWSVSVLVLIILGWAAFEGELGLGLLAAVLLVPIFGILPLAVVCIAIHAIAIRLRKFIVQPTAKESVE